MIVTVAIYLLPNHDNNIATIHITSNSSNMSTILVNITVVLDTYTAINYTSAIVATSENAINATIIGNMNNTASINSTSVNIIIGSCVGLMM